MPSKNTPEWLPEERSVSEKKWSEFGKRYATEMGFEEVPNYQHQLGNPSQFHSTQLIDQVRAFQDGTWHLFMPNDSIIRMKGATDHYEVFKEVVQETAENALGETEPTPIDLHYIAHCIINRLAPNDFEVEKVYSGEYESYSEHSHAGDDVFEDMTVIVSNLNSGNRNNLYIYQVADAPELFGSVLYSETQAAHQIYQADFTPDYIVRDVALNLTNPTAELNMVAAKSESFSGVAPPEQSVTLLSTDSHSRTSYCKIDSPQAVFGEDWGDIDAMGQHLTNESVEWKSIGTIGFWVDTGVNW